MAPFRSVSDGHKVQGCSWGLHFPHLEEEVSQLVGWPGLARLPGEEPSRQPLAPGSSGRLGQVGRELHFPPLGRQFLILEEEASQGAAQSH